MLLYNVNEEIKVLGIDIEPGYSTKRNRETTFSIALLNNDLKVLETKQNQTMKDILLYIKTEKPKIIATDNIFELVNNIAELKKLALFLPTDIIIVQVTGNPNSPTDSLIDLAKKENIIKEGKLSPIDTAIIAAKLAIKGYGFKIKLHEEETFIIVSKSIEPSAGGMSLERYKRKIIANIKQTIHEIKNTLITNNISYDFFPTKKNEGGIFIVYLPKHKLKKFIKPYEGYGFKIKLLPIIKNRLLPTKTLSYPSLPLIVGYDPGLTVGLAIIDFEGNLLYLESLKYTGINDICEIILKYGKPLIISTDKTNLPIMVERLSINFSSITFKPPRDLLVEEKKKIVNKFIEEKNLYNIKIDKHKRDALAAALYALNYYSKIYSTIKEEVNKLSLPFININKVLEKVIKYNKNIKEAIGEEISSTFIKEENKTVEKVEEKKKDEEIKKQALKILELEKYIEYLKKSLEEKNYENKMLKLKLEKLKEKDYIEIKKSKEIQILNKKIEEMKETINIISEEKKKLISDLNTLLEFIHKFIKDEYYLFLVYNKLNEIKHENKLKHIIVVKNIDEVDETLMNELVKKKIRVVIYSEKCNEIVAKKLNENDIAMLSLNELNGTVIKNLCFIKKDVLDSKVNNIELEKRNSKEELKRIIEEYRKFRI